MFTCLPNSRVVYLYDKTIQICSEHVNIKLYLNHLWLESYMCSYVCYSCMTQRCCLCRTSLRMLPYGLKQSFNVSNYSINIHCWKCNVIRMNTQILAQAVGCIQSCFLSMLTDRFVFIKAWILISTCSRPRIRPNITLSADDRGKNRVSLSWAAVYTSHKVRARLTHSVQESLRSRSFRNQRKEIQSGLFHSYFKMRHLTWETDQKTSSADEQIQVHRVFCVLQYSSIEFYL